MTAIFALTARQLAGSRRVWLVLALVALSVLAAVLFHVGETTTTSARFADNVTTTLIASGILLLVMLLFATSAFGKRAVDRTLGYLALKPLARWRIVLPKLAAAFVVGGPRWPRAGSSRSRSSTAAGFAGRSRPGSGCWWARPRTRRSSPGPGSRRGTRSCSAWCTCSCGGDARRLPRRRPLPEHPPVHARADPRARRGAAGAHRRPARPERRSWRPRSSSVPSPHSPCESSTYDVP